MTFWTLITEYSIRIPIVQRDYVQGREKDQVKDARRNLLSEMREALKNNNNIDLNFVYGKEVTYGKEKVFIPLDGQQRLTTLFLLHWFAFAKERQFDLANNLYKFSYETRISSRKFVEQLVKNIDTLANIINDNKSLKEQIQNEAWFWVDWSYDPTVNSMLIMLDEIRNYFNDISDLSDKLVNHAYISFRFLNMHNLGMEDTIYIKLNARGRQLTDFENFKAELIKYIEQLASEGKLDKNIAKQYPLKLDGEWADLIWIWTGNNKNNFDRIYMNCFHWMLWNRWAEKQTSAEKSNVQVSKEMNREEYYRLKNYEKYEAIDAKVIKDIYYTLTYFSSYLKQRICAIDNIKGIKWIKDCVCKDSVTYFGRVMLFAVTAYISYNKGNVEKDKEEKFSDWLRVIENLARNTRFDGLDDYIRAIRSIANLTENCNDILQYLASPKCSISGFLSEQVEEERLKAKLILKCNNLKCDDWKNAIYEAEQHPYFAGQIAFLFSFIGLNHQNVDNLSAADLNNYLQRFNVYKEKTSALFNENGLTIDANLFSRAVLVQGDYLLPYRSSKSFLIGSHRDISWKALLRNSNAQKRIYFKQVIDLLDNNNLTKAHVETQLRDIINNSTVNDWRKYFIEIDDVIKGCGYYRLIRHMPNDLILILSGQTTAGYNKEYYTYALYILLRKNRIPAKYIEDRGQYGRIFISGIKNKNIYAYYGPNPNQNGSDWQLCVVDRNNNITKSFSTVEDAFNYILTL